MCVGPVAKCPAARVAIQPPRVENSNDCGKKRSVSPCSLGQDGGHAVEPLELLCAAGLSDGAVSLDPGALLAHQQGDRLEPGSEGGQRVAALDAGLDLADGAREHRHDALVVESAAAPLARRRPGVAGLTLTSSSQELLLRSGRGGDRLGTGHQPPPGGRNHREEAADPATRCTTRSSRSARDHRSGPTGRFAERTHRAPLGARDTAIVAPLRLLPRRTPGQSRGRVLSLPRRRLPSALPEGDLAGVEAPPDGFVQAVTVEVYHQVSARLAEAGRPRHLVHREGTVGPLLQPVHASVAVAGHREVEVTVAVEVTRADPPGAACPTPPVTVNAPVG